MGAVGTKQTGSSNSIVTDSQNATVTASGTGIVASSQLNSADATRMGNEFQRIADVNADKVDTYLGSAIAKTYWQNLSDAASRLVDYVNTNNDGPRLTSGHAADVMFSALPSGSVIQITNAHSDSDNGTWIRGTSTDSVGKGGSAVWTHIADAQGNQIVRQGATNRYVSSDNWAKISGGLDAKNTRLRLVKYGS